jgi:hypothetical protein
MRHAGVHRHQVQGSSSHGVRCLRPSGDAAEFGSAGMAQARTTRRRVPSRLTTEFRRNRPPLRELRRRACSAALTLVYAAQDAEHNDAVILAEVRSRGIPRR